MKSKINLKGRHNIILLIFFSSLFFSGNGQTEFTVQHGLYDTINLEIHKYLDLPGFRYGEREKSITKIDVIQTSNDSRLRYKWNIQDSKVYFYKTVFDSVELDPGMFTLYDGLSLELEITKKGELVQLINFESLKDSIYSRYKLYNKKDSINRDLNIPNTENDIDSELFDYALKSSFIEKIFLDFHFPEVLLYFQINNKSLTLYQPNVEQVEMNFLKLGLFDIKMRRNTMLVYDDNEKSEVEIQYELTSEGCEKMEEQIARRIKTFKEFKIEKIKNFDCQRSRIIRGFKYDKSEKKIKSVYEKKTTHVNDEHFYLWTELLMK